jgi:hypothetical protein
MGTEWRCLNHGEKYNPWSDWCHHRSIGFIYAGYAFGDAKGQSQPQVRGADIPLTQFAQNITSYGQQGGITGIVNIGPQRLAFSSALVV